MYVCLSIYMCTYVYSNIDTFPYIRCFRICFALFAILLFLKKCKQCLAKFQGTKLGMFKTDPKGGTREQRQAYPPSDLLTGISYGVLFAKEASLRKVTKPCRGRPCSCMAS